MPPRSIESQPWSFEGSILAECYNICYNRDHLWLADVTDGVTSPLTIW